MGLGLYFLSPLEFVMGLRKPELYGFEFGEGKIRPCHAYGGLMVPKVKHRDNYNAPEEITKGMNQRKPKL
ncbi:hypothetical protein L195_g061406 [Trifolium pratense]|uniref:Uncharacterized protein n=1 Tax=Trifolium pratense TaxID=57577 RepID=A0A2K3K9P5_TRIPR|nr:hypothetical protein L195_g061406 [Trifolium pratense]